MVMKEFGKRSTESRFIQMDTNDDNAISFKEYDAAWSKMDQRSE